MPNRWSARYCATASARGERFSVRNEGVALNNASEGQQVQVRTSSGRTLGGIAGPDGMVEIRP